jgi:hypothetical protein
LTVKVRSDGPWLNSLKYFHPALFQAAFVLPNYFRIKLHT